MVDTFTVAREIIENRKREFFASHSSLNKKYGVLHLDLRELQKFPFPIAARIIMDSVKIITGKGELLKTSAVDSAFSALKQGTSFCFAFPKLAGTSTVVGGCRFVVIDTQIQVATEACLITRLEARTSQTVRFGCWTLHVEFLGKRALYVTGLTTKLLVKNDKVLENWRSKEDTFPSHCFSGLPVLLLEDVIVACPHLLYQRDDIKVDVSCTLGE